MEESGNQLTSLTGETSAVDSMAARGTKTKPKDEFGPEVWTE